LPKIALMNPHHRLEIATTSGESWPRRARYPGHLQCLQPGRSPASLALHRGRPRKEKRHADHRAGKSITYSRSLHPEPPPPSSSMEASQRHLAAAAQHWQNTGTDKLGSMILFSQIPGSSSVTHTSSRHQRGTSTRIHTRMWIRLVGSSILLQPFTMYT
jgi:hypothetical protein